jgi:hypothetical protein
MDEHEVKHFETLIFYDACFCGLHEQGVKGIVRGAKQFLDQKVELLSSLGTDTGEQHPAFRIPESCCYQLSKGGLDARPDGNFGLGLQLFEFGDKRRQVKSLLFDDGSPKSLLGAETMDRQSGVHSRSRSDIPEGCCLESVVGECGLGGPEQKQSCIWFGFARPAGLTADNWFS